MAIKPYLFVLSFFLLAFVARAQSIRLAPNVSPEMLRADYWLRRAEQPDAVRMTLDDIDTWNQDVKKDVFYKTKRFDYHHLYDLRSQPAANKEALLYTLAAYRPYNWFRRDPDGYEQPLDFLDVYDNMRLDEFVDSAAERPVRKAVCVRRTDLRNIPEDDFYINTFSDTIEDVNQASALLMNEPILVLYESADGEWYFIQSEYCFGWGRKEHFAFCTDEEFEDFFDFPRKAQNEFITITDDYVALRPDIVDMPADVPPFLVELFMGTHLFVADWSDDGLDDAFGERLPYASYAAKIPYRKADETLGWCYASVPLGICCMGLLPFTLENEFRLAFQCMGNVYGWGGMTKQRDCSSLLQDIFKCFGFTFPRNSRSQALMPGKTVDFPALPSPVASDEPTEAEQEAALQAEQENVSARTALMQTVDAGAILCIPGHVMLYLGQVDDDFFVISALGFYYSERYPYEERISAFSVNVNDLNMLRQNKKTWLQNLTTAKFLNQ